MKKFVSLCVSLFLIISCTVPAFAEEVENTILYQEEKLDNGLTIIDEVAEICWSRSSTKSYTRTKTLVDGDTTIAIIRISGEFSFDGTSVSVVSKSVIQADTYDGWKYTQDSFTSSGGTITLNGKITKFLLISVPFTMTLSCDKDGNISYT